jgi:hypothetical protein
MGGGGSKGGPTNAQAETAQGNLANQLTQLLQQQGGESNQLFNLAFPGQIQATDFYSALASGDPGKIASVISPAVQQVSQATSGAKQNIMQTAPAGGEKNLALEQADVSQGAQVGSLASQGYIQAFNALGQLGTSGVSQSTGAAGTAISAGQAAGNQWGQIVQQNIAQKGANLGAFSSLGSAAIGGGAELGAAGKGGAGLAGLSALA